MAFMNWKSILLAILSMLAALALSFTATGCGGNQKPSTTPSVEQSVEASTNPSTEQSVEPSTEVSVAPSVEPSEDPSVEPSTTPSVEPSVEPSVDPSVEKTPANSFTSLTGELVASAIASGNTVSVTYTIPSLFEEKETGAYRPFPSDENDEFYPIYCSCANCSIDGEPGEYYGEFPYTEVHESDVEMVVKVGMVNGELAISITENVYEITDKIHYPEGSITLTVDETKDWWESHVIDINEEMIVVEENAETKYVGQTTVITANGVYVQDANGVAATMTLDEYLASEYEISIEEIVAMLPEMEEGDMDSIVAYATEIISGVMAAAEEAFVMTETDDAYIGTATLDAVDFINASIAAIKANKDTNVYELFNALYALLTEDAEADLEADVIAGSEAVFALTVGDAIEAVESICQESGTTLEAVIAANFDMLSDYLPFEDAASAYAAIVAMSEENLVETVADLFASLIMGYAPEEEVGPGIVPRNADEEVFDENTEEDDGFISIDAVKETITSVIAYMKANTIESLFNEAFAFLGQESAFNYITSLEFKAADASIVVSVAKDYSALTVSAVANLDFGTTVDEVYTSIVNYAYETEILSMAFAGVTIDMPTKTYVAETVVEADFAAEEGIADIVVSVTGGLFVENFSAYNHTGNWIMLDETAITTNEEGNIVISGVALAAVATADVKYLQIDLSLSFEGIPTDEYGFPTASYTSTVYVNNTNFVVQTEFTFEGYTFGEGDYYGNAEWYIDESEVVTGVQVYVVDAEGNEAELSADVIAYNFYFGENYYGNDMEDGTIIINGGSSYVGITYTSGTAPAAVKIVVTTDANTYTVTFTYTA